MLKLLLVAALKKAKIMSQAAICFDHYHIIAMLNKAVDDVRKEAQKEITDEAERDLFYHSRMAFLYGAENLPEKYKGKFEQAMSISEKTARAWKIKELLRDLWKVTPTEIELKKYFKSWYWKATHSRLKPICKVAKTLKRHWDGILSAIIHGVSNSATEGLNSKIETIKRSACGFRNREKFKTAILFHCGKLDLMPSWEG